MAGWRSTAECVALLALVLAVAAPQPIAATAARSLLAPTSSFKTARPGEPCRHLDTTAALSAGACRYVTVAAPWPFSRQNCESCVSSPLQASSCWAFDLTKKAGSNFGGVSSPLPDNGVAAGSLWAVLHMCDHGILFPRTVWATSVKYYLDDPSHSGTPVGTKTDVSPYKLSLAGLKAGSHNFTVVATFTGTASGFAPFVATSRFRTAATPTRAASPTKAPTKPAASTGPRRFLPKYAQCGGAGSKCGGATQPCTDAQWPHTACLSSPSFTCRRQSKYYWQCRDSPF